MEYLTVVAVTAVMSGIRESLLPKTKLLLLYKMNSLI